MLVSSNIIKCVKSSIFGKYAFVCGKFEHYYSTVHHLMSNQGCQLRGIVEQFRSMDLLVLRYARKRLHCAKINKEGASDACVTPGYDDSAVHRRIRKLYNEIMATNWNDYWQLVINHAFWENEYVYIEQYMNMHYRKVFPMDTQPKVHFFLSTEVKALKSRVPEKNSSRYHATNVEDAIDFSKINEMDIEAQESNAIANESLIEDFNKLNLLMNILYICEDVRDHIIELLEAENRSAGIAGTGLFASPKISNIDVHCQLLCRTLEALINNSSYKLFSPKINESILTGIIALRHVHKFRFPLMHQSFY